METFSMEGSEFGGALAAHLLARLFDAESHLIQLFDARDDDARRVHLKAALQQIEALNALILPGVFPSSVLEGDD